MSRGEYDKTKTLVRLIFRYKFALILLLDSSITRFSRQIATRVFNKPEGRFVLLAGFVLILQPLYDFSTNLLFGTIFFTFYFGMMWVTRRNTKKELKCLMK